MEQRVVRALALAGALWLGACLTSARAQTLLRQEAATPAEFQSAPEESKAEPEAKAADSGTPTGTDPWAAAAADPFGAAEPDVAHGLASPLFEPGWEPTGALPPWESWGSLSPFARLSGWIAELARTMGLGADSAAAQSADSVTAAQIALYENAEVRKFMRLFVESHREAFLRGLARAGQYIPMIQEIFRAEGLPADLAYLAIIESNLNPRAFSPKRAAGLWQFMRETGAHFGLRVEPWYDERLDPVLSTQAAARMLRYLHSRFGNWELALAAYNAGESRVNQALRDTRSTGDEEDFWSLPLPLQTRRYVPSFIAVALIYNDLEAHGFTPFEPEKFLRYEIAEGPYRTTLRAIARRTDIPEAALVELNPAWRQGLIPPMHEGDVVLRLPPGGKRRLETALAAGPFPPPDLVTHRVSPGETLSGIAARYGVDMATLLGANRIPNRNVLRRGQKLSIPLPVPGGGAAARGDKT